MDMRLTKFDKETEFLLNKQMQENAKRGAGGK